ncbi:MAG: hypothetical protein ACXWUN_06125 [Allosphingosinicella sp.]
MKISTVALAAALIVSGSAVMIPDTPAGAQALESLRNRSRSRQQQPAEEAQQAQQAQIGELTREENAAIMPLYEAAQAQNWAGASAALPAAQAGAATPYGRYVVGQLQLQVGRGTSNMPMQAQAVDAMVASGGAPADALPQLLGVQAGLAIDAQNFAGAETALTRLLELTPNDAVQIERLAQVKGRLNKQTEALALFQRAAQIRQQAGQPVPEDTYRRMLNIAYQGRMGPQALELSRTLITNYPSPTNWHDALAVYRELNNPDEATKLDIYRLMRVAQALTSERDYVEYAEAAERGAMFGEVKAVLDEGLGRNAITAANSGYARQMLTTASGRITEDRASLTGERTRALAGSNGVAVLRLADAYYGYGQFADAAALYRAALEKGGVDANLVNIRLGAALAQAGQRAEAETALRAVTGPRQELANFWLAWLSRRT